MELDATMVNASQTRRAERLVLQAIAAHPVLGQKLVLKGAHAIEALTGTARSTRDIDLTARERFVQPGKDGAAYLKKALREALEDYIEKCDNKWSVYQTSATPSPSARPHRYGWDGYTLKATLQHLNSRHHVVEIDLSFGDLTDGTVFLEWRDASIVITNTHPAGALPCYSVEQALAEKLRAWLQKLPPYLNKIGSSEAPPRVRDLRDIHVLLEMDPSALDWDLLGRSFVDKCKVRFVDCCSTADLLPEGVSLDLVRSLYEAEDALRDVPFDRAWESIHGLVTRLHERGAMPGIVPLPEP